MQKPKTEEEIKTLGIFGRKSVVYLAPQALEIMRNVKAGEQPIWRRVEPLTKNEKKLCSAMMKDLTRISEELGVAQALLGTRKDVESLYRHRQSKKLMNGWREEHVGQKLLDFVKVQEV